MLTCVSDYGSIFKDDQPGSIFKDDPFAQGPSPSEQPPAVGAVGAQQGLSPLLVSAPITPVLASETAPNALPLALLAGAGVALLGGLLWAGVVIATHWDIGILAW